MLNQRQNKKEKSNINLLNRKSRFPSLSINNENSINYFFSSNSYPHLQIVSKCYSGSRLRPKTLQAVDVPVIDNRVCERWHRSNGINVVIYDEMMCAGYRGGGKDSCQVSASSPWARIV